MVKPLRFGARSFLPHGAGKGPSARHLRGHRSSFGGLTQAYAPSPREVTNAESHRLNEVIRDAAKRIDMQ